MILNIFFMVIVASFLASVFLKYLDLKDSVLAAYVTLSLASLSNWLVLKKPVTDVTIGLRWSVLLVIVAEIIFIVSFIQGAVASRMFEPVFNWFSATLLSSGSIKSVLNIYDLGGLQDYHKIIFLCVALNFSAIVISYWVNYATPGATKTDYIIGFVSIVTVFLIGKLGGFEELFSIAVSPPLDFPISGVGLIFVAVFIFLSIMPIGVAYESISKFISCNFFISTKIFFFVFISTLLIKDSELARSVIALFI